MGRSRRKMEKYEMILGILLLAVIAAGLLLPETGNLVLLDELCGAAVIWMVCIYVIARVLRNRAALSFSGKVVGAAAVILCIAAVLWFSKDVGLDLAAGPQTATLTDIQLTGAQAHTGIFSRHYDLLGTDSQGERIRVEISGQDYERLEAAGRVFIEYYPNTKRVVKVLPA